MTNETVIRELFFDTPEALREYQRTLLVELLEKHDRNELDGVFLVFRALRPDGSTQVSFRSTYDPMKADEVLDGTDTWLSDCVVPECARRGVPLPESVEEALEDFDEGEQIAETEKWLKN